MGLQRFSKRRTATLSARIGIPLFRAWNTQGDRWRIATPEGRVGWVVHKTYEVGWEDDPKPPPLLADCEVSHEDMMAWLARVGD